MIKAGAGSIVNISSIAAVTGLPMVPAYSAAKGGLSALTRQLAFDYGPHNIRANAIITGLIVHEGSKGQVDTPEKYKAYRVRHLTRLGVPDDIANAAIYLASDESEFVTGSHINVEGGVLVKSRPDAELIAGTCVEVSNSHAIPPTDGRLHADELIAASQRATGLSDFGDTDPRESLGRLVQSLNEEARLTDEGVASQASQPGSRAVQSIAAQRRVRQESAHCRRADLGRRSRFWDCPAPVPPSCIG